MGGKYLAYPEYKDSGIEWLGDVPESWLIARMDDIAPTIKDQVSPRELDSKNVMHYSIPTVQEIGTGKDEDGSTIDSNKFRVLSGDVLFSKLNPRKQTITIVGAHDNDMVASTEFVVLRADERDQKYLKYVLMSQELKSFVCSQVESATRSHQRINPSVISKLKMALPAHTERQKITTFLDHETAKIDALIEKQQQLIKLLKEKRQAVISHAVTKGLNPDAPMRDSGVEWLGEVPAHWKVSAIKYQMKSLDSRRIPLSGEEREKRKGNYRYYGASGVIDQIDDYIFDESTVLVGEDGANLVNRSTPLAFSAKGQYWVNNHAHILRPPDDLADYWAEAIEHIDVNPLVSGAAQPKLTAEALNNLVITYSPDYEERKNIETFILQHKKKFQVLTDKASKQIELLQERRAALISAAVTGKIDVRGWQSPSQENKEDVA